MSNEAVRCLETEWWQMELPPEWYGEQDGEVIAVGDEDGVGVLEFSTLHKQAGSTEPAEVMELMQDMEVDLAQCEPIMLGPFSGFHRRSVDEEYQEAVREWWLAGGSLLLYVTYSCHTDHAGYDDSCVDEMLATLDFSAPAERVEH